MTLAVLMAYLDVARATGEYTGTWRLYRDKNRWCVKRVKLMSAIRRKGAACALAQSGPGYPVWTRTAGNKWPASQCVQPDDAPPKLESVDANDPPGRVLAAETLDRS